MGCLNSLKRRDLLEAGVFLQGASSPSSARETAASTPDAENT